jgi:hypothetical protein
MATEIALRSSEEWALKRYLTMDALEGAEKPNPQLLRIGYFILSGKLHLRSGRWDRFTVSG